MIEDIMRWEGEGGAVADQPPIPNGSRPIWDRVIEDMRERDRVGRERYGTPLQSHNGRDGLVDLYQELLDAVVYIRKEIAEREDLRARIAMLESAIRSHRDQRGDDRCWIDDCTLYAVLSEGGEVTSPPLPPPDEMLANCRRYIASRHCPGEPYVSPQRRIEELEAKLAAAESQVKEMRHSADLRWKANMRGIKLWQAAAPSGEDRSLEWPGHAELLAFLLERIGELERSAK